jgi:hypothetical protein
MEPGTTAKRLLARLTVICEARPTDGRRFFRWRSDRRARRLRELGFEVPEGGARNPSWTRNELIVALDLYAPFKGNPPGKDSAEIIGLSDKDHLNKFTPQYP